MTSTEKLIDALVKAEAPKWMIEKAQSEGYNDFNSQSATPIVDLYNDLKLVAQNAEAHNYLAASTRFHSLASDAASGAFDATDEESDAWAEEAMKDPRMRSIYKKLFGTDPK